MEIKPDSPRDKATPLSPWFVILLWMLLGSAMVIFNKAVLSTWHFNFPCFLTAWHCLVASILTHMLAWSTNYLPGVKESKVTNHTYYTKVLPISVFFALGLLFGNSAYSFLSVAYIQMLKSFTPIPMLFMSYLSGREKPSFLQISLIFLISTGIAMTSVGEAKFSYVGFFLQIGGILADVSRTTVLDMTLTDIKLDPLSLMYYMMPPSFLFISIGFYFQESHRFPWVELASSNFVWILATNGLLAFVLNISIVLVVKYTSPVTLSLAGIVKDIGLVFSSLIIFQNVISEMQVVGYGISIIGLFLYKTYRTDPKYFHHIMSTYKDITSVPLRYVLGSLENSDSNASKKLSDLDIENNDHEDLSLLSSVSSSSLLSSSNDKKSNV